MAKLSSNNQLMVSVFNNIWDTDNENLTKNCDVKTILDIIRTGIMVLQKRSMLSETL